jgi:hypothetical protein
VVAQATRGLVGHARQTAEGDMRGRIGHRRRHSGNDDEPDGEQDDLVD